MGFAGKLLKGIVLPIGDLITGGTFSKELKIVRGYFDRSSAEIKVIQKHKLNKLLDHASVNSPYYRNLKIKKHDDPAVWLSEFPILEKDILRNKAGEILTVDRNKLVKINSSGSSGYQTTVYQSKVDRSKVRAVQTAFWERSGFEIGSPVVQTGINPNRTLEKKVKDVLFRTLYVPAFAMSIEDAKNCFRWVKNYKTGKVVLVGYASSLYVLAEMSEKINPGVQFKSVISLGDKLFDHYRTKIESEFKTKVHETYGASEGLMMGFQSDLDYMYVPDFHVFIEIVNDQGEPVKEGEMGHVLVTSFDNFAMPLIRYRVGDLAVKLPQEDFPKEKELPFSLLQKVVGRDTDIVRTPSGKKIVVHSFTGIFEHWPQISQFCVLQENIDGIIIEYIPSDDFERSVLTAIKRTLSEHIKEVFDIQFVEVDEIKPTKSGKPQLIISNLNS